jgi:NAD(P)-dependent dehydrogenase (short-subunit alcohol dehydrogenase family)
MLSNKTIIVTGGGNGIGEAVAIKLGNYGANIVVNDLGTTSGGEASSPEPAESTAEAIRKAGGNAIINFGDASSMECAETLITEALDTFGRINGIVNFAGIVRNNPIADLTRDDWDAVVDVHLGSHFAQLRALVSHVQSSDVNREWSFLGVSNGVALGGREQVAYATSKAGVLGLVRSASDELQDAGVRVNALMPQGKSRQNSCFPNTGDDDRNIPDAEYVAPVVGFLMSDAAAGVEGCTIRVSGEMVGLVSDPQPICTAYREGGWTPKTVADRFAESFR